MKRTGQWGLTLVTAALIGSGSALMAAPGGGDAARPGGPGREPGMERRQGPPPAPNPERLKELGATEAQIQALKTVRYEQEKQNVTLRANLEHAELDMRHAMDATPVDGKAVMAAVDAVNAARGELFKAEITGALKVRETLGDALFQKVHSRPEPPQMGDRPEPGAAAGGHGPQERGPQDRGGQERGGPGNDRPQPRE